MADTTDEDSLQNCMEAPIRSGLCRQKMAEWSDGGPSCQEEYCLRCKNARRSITLL